ncbi:MAG: hypothetical protein QM831_12880 [Kofleriaceae bacterium]
MIALLSGCADEPCATDNVYGDPIDGYCAAIDVTSPTDFDHLDIYLATSYGSPDPARIVDELARGGITVSEAEAATFQRYDVSTTGRDRLFVQWSPWIDAGWTGSAAAIGWSDGSIVSGAKIDLELQHGDNATYWSGTLNPVRDR